MSLESSVVRMPAEWESHEAVWLAWPAAEDLWQAYLAPAQQSFIRFCEVIADRRDAQNHGERLHIIVRNEVEHEVVYERLKHLEPKFFEMPYGDIWLRDTAPIFVRRDDELVATCFLFNGWGEKYVLPFDHEVSDRIAKASKAQVYQREWILEGGAIETNGDGMCLTTEQCLLNKNRNPSLSRIEIERRLREDLGFEKIGWIRRGLLNDHTDGHIDTLVRFINDETVVCMEPEQMTDPNVQVLKDIIQELKALKNVRGKRLEIVTVPSPGEVLNVDKEIMPASYVNFYMSNTAVAVPLYECKADDRMMRRIENCFPGRRIEGINAKPILTGGGAFHCISQQQPCVEINR